MNIPALINVPVTPDWDGKMAIVDGHTGTFYIDPDEETVKDMQAKREKDLEARRLLQELKGKENVSLDGQKINLFANIGSLADVGSVLQNDGGGIGLFRSEFIYIGRDTMPTEEEQFSVYKTVAENMAGKKVIIRTLDIGADKQVDYLGLEKEDNPALGFRAIRICLTKPEIFKTQLRAIYRASVFGRISIMYPMITSVEEVEEIQKIVTQVKAELDADGIPYGEVEQGIMIETPAAAVISDELAKMVDFFSIGTNDLTQYTLAMDRQNDKLDRFYNSHHKAILRLIQKVVENGHAGGAWVGICGELGADTSLTETFLQMGVDELSVSPSMILPVRDAIRKSHAKKA
jgi:phosphotransferase system enzyme I (PtsI)